jgi:hypothetical protein
MIFQLFGFVKKELLQTAEAEISKLTHKVSVLDDTKSNLSKSLKLSRDELTQIKESDLYKSSKTLDALRLEITLATKNRLIIEDEINQVKNEIDEAKKNRLTIIEAEAEKQKGIIKETKKTEIESELRGLVEKKISQR